MFSEGGELGPEFSEAEKENLGFVKDLADKGKIGGPEDKPPEGREFAKHPEPPEAEKADPAWKNLPPELQEEVKMVLGPQVVVSRERSSSPEEQGKDRYTQVRLGSILDKALVLLERYYPEFGISTKDEPPVTENGYELNKVGVWAPPDKEEDFSRVFACLSDNRIMKVLENLDYFVLEGKEADNNLFIQHLDRQGVLAQEDFKRLIAYDAKSLADRIESKCPKTAFWENRVAVCRNQIERLNVEPYSDEEVSNFLLEKVLVPEFGSPKESV